MLRVLLLIIGLVFSHGKFVSQTNVYLNINHKFGTSPFSLGSDQNNSLGEVFDVSRLEYYISSISIKHDGGNITNVLDKTILVDAGSLTYDSLGMFNITSIEGISFGIGVDSSKNHLDPSLYPSNHPLAPKSPSMHWGWAAGYRFAVMEGDAGLTASTYNYQIHGLGDQNFFMQSITTAGTSDSNGLVIELNADYLEALRDISIANGPSVHSDVGIAKTLLENFLNHVFTSREGNSSVGTENNFNKKNVIKIYPNLIETGSQVYVQFNADYVNLNAQVISGKGTLVFNENVEKSFVIENLAKGVYTVLISNDNGWIASKKFIVY